ncbi:MAG: aminoacetone oxidase family FAD-binding enzyme [Sulfurovum sp.]|jgi:predicted Rossmann fold flavoprotein
MIYDVAIIGGGASGLMFASYLNKRKYKDVCILETNTKLAQKLKVSGGSKCNITNDKITVKNYLGDESLVANLLKEYTNKDLLNYLNKNGVYPKINPKIVKGTYFCNSSQDVIDMFSKTTSHIKKFLDTKVLDLDYKNEIYEIKTNKQKILARKVVVSSGGLSYPALGASSVAYDIAKKYGHTIQKCEPALVGYTVQKDQFWFKKLAGVSLTADIYIDKRKFEGSFLFAHKGCSGPVVLTSSLFWQKGKIAVDFLPKKSVDKLLVGNKNISTALPLPKRFIIEFLESINLSDKSISKLTIEEREKLKTLNYYEFAPAGNFGYTKAEVTKGGISTNEISHKTFESKLQKNLYFIGECLDITGQLGGFNFQIVFAQSYKCAISL